MTSIEKAMLAYLEKQGKDYTAQYPVDRYRIDFYVPTDKMFIECDGKWWHQDEDKERKRDRAILVQYPDHKIAHVTYYEQAAPVWRVYDLEQLNHDGEFVYLPIEIVKAERITLKRGHKMYDFAVEGDESYVAKGFISHNCRCTTVPYNPMWELLDEEGVQQAQYIEGQWEEPSRFTTREEAIQALRDRTINGGLINNDPDSDVYSDAIFDFTLKEAEQIVDALDNTIEKYGINFTGVYKTDLFDDDSVVMDTVAYRNQASIRINKNGDLDGLTKANEDGWIFASDFESAFYHELGHAARFSHPEAVETINILYDNNSHILPSVSRYSAVNAEEMMAEAFLNYEKEISPGAKQFTDYLIKTIYGF